ncbi:MAG: J domain-containing protein [Actinomycetota bacterium]|nr:J domain-containing protein [Actinomycetota bacterium]
MLLAELVIRHSRRHMPTRRVALEGAYLPTSGPAHGAALLAAVVAAHLPGVDEEQRELLPRLLKEADGGLAIPRIAMRHRLQHDTHGLDRSSHRMFGEEGLLVVEIDVHGGPSPQVLGAVMAAASLPSSGRAVALGAVRRVIEGRWTGLAREVEVRTVWGRDQAPPPLAGVNDWRQGAPPEEEAWRGVAPDQRWAMEVLGLRSGMDIDRDDVNRRFRRLLREAHPDHGGAKTAAAGRIAELTEARAILLPLAPADVAAGG